MNEKYPSGRECKVCERNVWASTGGSQDMATPTGQGLCSPTSAFEKERMLSEGLRNPSVLMDSDIFIVRETRHEMATC